METGQEQRERERGQEQGGREDRSNKTTRAGTERDRQTGRERGRNDEEMCGMHRQTDTINKR